MYEFVDQRGDRFSQSSRLILLADEADPDQRLGRQATLALRVHSRANRIGMVYDETTSALIDAKIAPSGLERTGAGETRA